MFDAKYKSSYVNDTVYDKIDNFWKWFDLNKYEIESAIEAQRREIVQTIEDQLRIVYIDAKRGVPFAVGKKDDMYCIYLYYGRDSYLLTIGDTVMNCMPKNLKNSWRAQYLIKKTA
jgi:hypothetical protein